jgi:hypothetical protein
MNLRRFTSIVWMPLALLACTSEPTDPGDDSEVEADDLRRDFPEATPDAVVFTTPDLIIPPYTDMEYCWVTTYHGPDVGLTGLRNYQSVNGHHVVILGTTETERSLPDDTIWDCTTTESLGMANMEPIIVGGGLEYVDDGVDNVFDLPPGMASEMESGQRIVVQSHYINPTDTPIRVKDQTQYLTMPVEDVQEWASVLALTDNSVNIPVGATDYTTSFDCTIEDTYSLVYLGGHMHEWGKAFSLDRKRGDSVERIYEVATWDPVYRDAPIINTYKPGEFMIEAGDTFTTTCTWYNDQDKALTWPHEMCVSFAMIHPSKVPVICDVE